MIGRVVSTKMNRTAVVLVERVAMHPLYKKTFIRTKKYLADDSLGVKDGDIVELVKVRPISKNKHWKILKVLGKNLAEITEEKLKAEAEKIVAEVMPESPENSEGLGKPDKSDNQKIRNSETLKLRNSGALSIPSHSEKKIKKNKKENK